ncbi:S-layer homology domain-containing protein [Paenibacillus sp. MSJ-34]|uniref:S-layer homology domain-containing protein n=1 Tax=Paenibacillus sp. MSJ-34 TaxID=2841529 RepID=UPI001C11E391|nr:S-layer homology domain-containing protein [Paenibacillus sp. MSJ-34]MBU5442302.1 S-layer homology domain-containing protein [Paenibacillus sp. MSJ-34]
MAGSKKRTKRWMALLLSVCLLLGAANIAAASGAASDLEGHWAETTMKEWIGRGDLRGDGEGSYRPNESVSRVEFVAFVNRAFQFTDRTDIEFTDVLAAGWEHDEIGKALQAGYIQGYADLTFRPDQTITREEAAVILAKLIDARNDGTEDVLASMKDAGQLAPWSKSSVAAVLARGSMKGYENGTFGPKRSITRAEAIVAIDNAFQAKKPAVRTYDKSGTYGPEEGSETVQGNAVINAADTTLKNMTISGDLLISEGVGAGEVYLNNVQVQGKTIVQGGGENSVHLKDATIVQLIVEKKAGAVRVVAEGSTEVGHTIVLTPAKLQEDALTGAGFTNVELAERLPAGSKVTFIGQFEEVSLSAAQISVDMPKGSIAKLQVTERGGKGSLQVGKEAVIAELVLHAVMNVSGTGKVQSATLNDGSQGSQFAIKPGKLEGPQKDGVRLPVPESSSEPGSSGGSSGGANNGGSNGGGSKDSANEYKLKVLPGTNMQKEEADELLATNAEYVLIEESGSIVEDEARFNDAAYLQYKLQTVTDAGRPYAGKVRVKPIKVASSSGGTMQLFAYDKEASRWSDIVRTGFGPQEGTDISAWGDHHGVTDVVYSVYVNGEAGTYQFRIELEDVASHKTVAQSDLITYKIGKEPEMAFSLRDLVVEVDGQPLTLKQYGKDQNSAKTIGFGFDDNVRDYGVYIPNDITSFTWTASPKQGAISIRYSIIGGYPTERIASGTMTGGTPMSVDLKPGLGLDIFLDRPGSKDPSYVLRVKRIDGDEGIFNDKDIRVTAQKGLITAYDAGIKNTVNVYSEDGTLLGSGVSDNSQRASVFLDKSIALPETGTIYVTVVRDGQESEKVKKVYDSREIAQLDDIQSGIIVGQSGDQSVITFVQDDLNEKIRDFDYMAYLNTFYESSPFEYFHELLPERYTTLMPRSEQGEIVYKVKSNSPKSDYRRFAFYNKYDELLGWYDIQIK